MCENVTEFSDFGNIEFHDSTVDIDRQYYMNVREFSGGRFEAVLKTVRPMQMEEAKYRASCPGAVSVSTSVLQARRAENDPEAVESDRQANVARAVRRAKQNVRWLCMVMDADRLFTLTYRDNQSDREQTRADFSRFLRLVRSGWRGQVGIPDWHYVAVLERQERGAFHIHCAVKGWQRISYLRAAWYKALGGSGLETGLDTPGQVNVTNPDRARWGHTGREWRVNRLVRYLTKYLAKTFDETTTEKHRYWKSKDIKVPGRRRHWVMAFSMTEAIKSAWKTLELDVGLTPDCYVWLSPQNDSFFISGGS